jgi:phage gp29-like protein
MDKKEYTKEIAAASLRDRWSDYPSSGLTPGKLSRILREADAGYINLQAELFSEMEHKDAHLFSCLQTRKLSVAGCPWEVLPGSGGGAAENKAASFVSDCLSGVDNFDESLADLMDAVGKGFSVSEIIWELDHDFLVPRSLKKRPQKRFTFLSQDGPSERPLLLTDDEPVYGVPLPPSRFIVHVYRAGADYPERGGLLRTLSWIYLFKNYALKDWVSFCEVFGMPLRLGVYSPSASKEDKDALMEAVTNLGSDAAGIISESTRIQFIESAKRGDGGPYKDLVDVMNKEISKAVLGQTLTTEVGSSGSLAAGVVHDGVRMDIVRADARSLASTINRDLVRPLTALNFGPDVKQPVFKFTTN